MNYKEKDGKYIFEKEGVYFSLTLDQVKEMHALTKEIKASAAFDKMVKSMEQDK